MKIIGNMKQPENKDECNSIWCEECIYDKKNCDSDNYEIDSRVTWIRDKGLIASNWITKLDDYEIEGFTPTDATSVMGGSGKFPVWLADGILNESGLIDGETENHWVTCYLVAGELCRAGYTDVRVHNWGGQKVEDMPDITLRRKDLETVVECEGVKQGWV